MKTFESKTKRPFIIAEISSNHNQSFERLFNIVEAAAKAGVSAIKLQTFLPDEITLNSSAEHFIINDSNSLWDGKRLHDLYVKAMTPWEWHKPIFDRCKELGIIGFSTPFHDSAVDFLEELDVPIHKIASFENNDIPLLKKVASTGKPVIMSTGMASIEELDEAVDTLRSNGCKQITLLKCTSTYPASPKDSNLLTIPDIKKRFGVEVGLSDHTMGIGVSVASIALGATVIEKHFTLTRSDGGLDSSFSMEPNEMKQLVEEGNIAYKALGNVKYGPASNNEEISTNYRRSIYIFKNINKGEILSTDNVKIVRPAFGLEPRYWEEVIGKKASTNITEGSPLSWDLID